MLNLSANISLLFTESPFLERFEKASKNNFQAVEFQFPYEFSPETIKEKLDKFNLDLSVFNSLPGNFKNGDRGLACLPKRKKEFQRTIIQSIEFAKIILIMNLEHPKVNIREHIFVFLIAVTISNYNFINIVNEWISN